MGRDVGVEGGVAAGECASSAPRSSGALLRPRRRPAPLRRRPATSSLSWVERETCCGGSGDGGQPAAKIGPAPTGRAKCSMCAATFEKGTLRATTFSASAFHDGYDASHYHALCAPASARGSFDPKATLLLPWRDQLTFSADESQKNHLRSNSAAQAASGRKGAEEEEAQRPLSGIEAGHAESEAGVPCAAGDVRRRRQGRI